MSSSKHPVGTYLLISNGFLEGNSILFFYENSEEVYYLGNYGIYYVVRYLLYIPKF